MCEYVIRPRGPTEMSGGALAFASNLKFIYNIPLSHYHFRQPPSQSPHFFLLVIWLTS
jgi:hypothetical protein